MIIWINGTFGAGKTTTGTLVVEQDHRMRLFDPEWVGYMLLNNLADQRFTDFQQLESWRRLTPIVADEVARFTGQTLVAVQAVLDKNYWDDLVTGLSALGHRVVHILVEADEAIMKARIDADEVEAGARQWRHQHLATYAAARAWMTERADLVINTTALRPDEVADRVLAHVADQLTRN